MFSIDFHEYTIIIIIIVYKTDDGEIVVIERVTTTMPSARTKFKRDR